MCGGAENVLFLISGFAGQTLFGTICSQFLVEIVGARRSDLGRLCSRRRLAKRLQRIDEKGLPCMCSTYVRNLKRRFFERATIHSHKDEGSAPRVQRRTRKRRARRESVQDLFRLARTEPSRWDVLNEAAVASGRAGLVTGLHQLRWRGDCGSGVFRLFCLFA